METTSTRPRNLTIHLVICSSALEETFYSPNCSRWVNIPVPDDWYPFYVIEARFKNFLSPWWWALPYHYLSFIPLCPLFNGIVFECLWDIVSETGPTVDGRFALSSWKIDHWLEIEDSLMVVSHILDKGFFTRLWPSLSPILPSILSFKKMFSSLWVACLHIAASHDLFLLWMTLISSKIAAIEAVCEDWLSYLVEHKCLKDWVSVV